MMKGPWSWIMYLLFVNATLSVFVMIGAFGSYGDTAVVSDWGITDIATFIGLSGFTGIGTLGLGTLTMAIAIKSGISPFLAVSYGVVVAIYTNTWAKLWVLIDSIATTAGEFSFIIGAIALITATAFGYIMLKTLVEMGASARHGT